MPRVTIDILAQNKTSAGVAAANRAMNSLKDRSVNVTFKGDASKIVAGLPQDVTIPVEFKGDASKVVEGLPDSQTVDVEFKGDPNKAISGLPDSQTVDVEFKGDPNKVIDGLPDSQTVDVEFVGDPNKAIEGLPDSQTVNVEFVGDPNNVIEGLPSTQTIDVEFNADPTTLLSNLPSGTQTIDVEFRADPNKVIEGLPGTQTIDVEFVGDPNKVIEGLPTTQTIDVEFNADPNQATDGLPDSHTIDVEFKGDPNQATKGLPDSHTIDVEFKGDPNKAIDGMPGTQVIDVEFVGDPNKVVDGLPSTQTIDVEFVGDPNKIIEGLPGTQTVDVEFKGDASRMLADAPTEHVVSVKWDVPPIPAPSQISVPVGAPAPAGDGGGGGGGAIPGVLSPAAIAAATVTAGMMLSHRTITDFKSLEEAQVRMKALGDLTDPQVDEATAAAQEIGASDWSQFSTVDAMGAIDMLLRNGVVLEEALKLLTGIALSASAAAVGEQDPKELFAPMADVATDIANIWGLSADEASLMMEWMVAASARSKFDLMDMAYAVSRGGPGASMAGMSATDFFHMLATVAPQYQSGQMAGTNMASLITSMAALSKKQTDTYEQYGFLQPDTIVREQKKVARKDAEGELVKDEEGEQVYDTVAGDITSARTTLFDESGKILSPEQLGQELQGKLGDLPPDLLNEALSIMFGTFGKNIALALMRAAQDDNFAEVKKAMEGVDVKKMAETRSSSIQAKEVVLGGKLESISAFAGKDPAKVYRAFLEAADNLASDVLEGMQDREAEKAQQRQLKDAFNKLPLQLQEQEILSGFNPQTGLYDQERALQPVQTSGLGRLATETLYKGRSLIQDPEGGEIQKLLGEQVVQAGIEMLQAAQMMQNAGEIIEGWSSGDGQNTYANVVQIIADIQQDGPGLPSDLKDEIAGQKSRYSGQGIPSGAYPGTIIQRGQGIRDIPTGHYPGETIQSGQGPLRRDVPTGAYPGMTTQYGQGLGDVPTGAYPGMTTQPGQGRESRWAAGGIPGTTQFTSGEAEGIATFVQLLTGMLSGAGDVAVPVSPDLDMFIAEIANAQFPAIEIEVIPRFNWEGGDLQGPPPNTYWNQGQGGTLQGPAQGPQTQADRSDDRRHSNNRTVVRSDIDEGGALSDPLGAPTFGI